MCGKSIDFLELSVNAGNVYNLLLEKSSCFMLTSSSFYRENLNKSLNERYGKLSRQCDEIVHNANSEISNLQKRVSGKYYKLPPHE